MSVRIRAVHNLSATWLGLAVQGIVSFLLSPFILHRLGDEAFSIWILIFVLTGWFGLLDFGIRSSIVRYTARFIASNDKRGLRAYLSTSLVFYGLIALVVLSITTVSYFYLPLLFKIPAGLLRTARLLLLLSGSAIAITFPLSVFTGALEGLQKFAWLQLSQMGLTVLRAALIVVAMLNGGGLLTIGAITVAINVAGYVIFSILAIRVLPVTLRIRMADMDAFRKMANYGLFALAILAAEKLRFQSDAMVVGAFLPATAITLFSIGSKLVEYSSYPVRSMAQLFTPMASEVHVRDDLRRLQKILFSGNRACALIVFPICVTLVVLGKPVISAWVGGRYISAYPVLLLLLVPRTLYVSQAASTKLLLGMGRHRVLACVLLLEGTANLLLSLLLVRPLGLIGVALGTAIPLSVTGLLFLPRHLCKLLNVPLRTFLTRTYGLPLALCFPLATILWLVRTQVASTTYSAVVAQVGAGGLVYGLSLGIALWRQGASRPKSWYAFSQLLEPK